MREVVHLQVGKFGNQTGHRFWELLLSEHGLSPNGAYSHPDLGSTKNSLIDTYFHESGTKAGPSYIPRAVLVDLDPDGVDSVRASAIGGCFRPDNFFCEQYGTGNCWATGFYDRGEALMDVLMDSLRREVERCDSLMGFQIVHSLGGGTGSGLGVRLLSRITEQYPDSVRFTFSLFPNPSFGYNSAVEPYNTVLAMNYLIEYASSSVCMDEGVAWRRVQEKPSRQGFECLAAQMMADVTACNRFTGQISGDFRKLLTNLVIYPRMHFLVPGLSLPTHSPSLYPYTIQALPILIEQLFDLRNLMVTCNPQRGRYFAIAALFRGQINAYELEERISNLKDVNSSQFVQWMPNNVKCILTDPPHSSSSPSPTSLSFLFSSSSPTPTPSSARVSATYLGNTSAIQDLFTPILADFDALFRRKAYLNPFTNVMEEMEEAQSNMQDLILEYEFNSSNRDFNDDEIDL